MPADVPKPAAAAPAAEPLLFAGPPAWDAWLRRHHAASPGVWLRLSKAGAPEASVTYLEAIEVALCHGWIDGQKKSLDAHYWLQRFSPRRPRSVWSKINRAKAGALIAAGRMLPAGLREVLLAQADGRWEAAYDGARDATVPADLQAAFETAPRAAAFFATIDATNRYAVLWRVQTAVKPATRARRIALLVAMLERGEKIHG